jgi:hypothetical protein
MHHFPPRSLESVILLRSTLLSYADTYPVRAAHGGRAGPPKWGGATSSAAR